MRILDPASLPKCQMDRIVCHWSEGNYRPNDVDRKAYHLLIDGDGGVHFGHFSIEDNVSTRNGRYAAHTLHCNTRSIGVACCCMVGCRESPFEPGRQPMKQEQWETMGKVVADLCEFYRIPVSRQTVLGHGEVQDNLGITQKEKWDPLVLPWDSSTFDVSKTRHAVGDRFRAEVLAQLSGAASGAVNAVTGVARAISAAIKTALRSAAFAGNADVETIAAGHRVLRTSGQPTAGVGVLQDALNRLADAGMGDYRIDLDAANKFRGYFGQRTERAVLAFQRENRLREDGVVGESTIRALDEALLRLEQTPVAVTEQAVACATQTAVPVAGTVTPSGYAPAAASARLFRGLDFSTADEEFGREFVEAYAAADRDTYTGDPSSCKALLRFADGTVYFDAKMAICADGSPRAKQIDRPYGQTVTRFSFPNTNLPFNAEHVPYIVLPKPSKDGSLDFARAFGISSYDLAAVVYRDKYTPAFFAEIGPTFRLGEASIAVHENLPVPFPWTSPRRDRVLNASVESDVIYCVFPNSAVMRGPAMSEAEWLDETLQAAIVRFERFASGRGGPELAPLG
jgi:peptidoglycan hydrolase-like protein with peptidoglycan-binding domain